MMGDEVAGGGGGYEPVDPLHASLMGLERVRTLLHHHECKGPARTRATVGLHQRKPGCNVLLVKVWECEDKRRVSPQATLG